MPPCLAIEAEIARVVNPETAHWIIDFGGGGARPSELREIHKSVAGMVGVSRPAVGCHWAVNSNMQLRHKALQVGFDGQY